MFHYFILESGGTSSTSPGITCYLRFYWKEQSSEKLPHDLSEKVCLCKAL